MEGRRITNDKPPHEPAVETSCRKGSETETKIIPIIVGNDSSSEHAALRQLRELFRLSQVRQRRTHFNGGCAEVLTGAGTDHGTDFDRSSVTENLTKRANLT